MTKQNCERVTLKSVGVEVPDDTIIPIKVEVSNE
jgi:hypothetical protein